MKKGPLIFIVGLIFIYAVSRITSSFHSAEVSHVVANKKDFHEPTFELAVTKYKEGRYEEARKLFIQIPDSSSYASQAGQYLYSIATKSQQEVVALMPNQKIKDWKSASEKQRLALCIGFATVADKQPGIKVSARDFYNCIEEGTKGLPSTDELIIFDVADACLGLMRR